MAEKQQEQPESQGAANGEGVDEPRNGGSSEEATARAEDTVGQEGAAPEAMIVQKLRQALSISLN